ncbi:GNAT family N-acetyltransferase [Streptomyces sp. SPB4]|uniref:GNAT family N-acetyltransferase n=1 Tax=Streptomyces sp. SPB4 TaxID=2940553 RepID=UPI002474966F|nr:GNAT family N-acetyltransferase [Streptomyces sp. SPB4]MDH6545203.1 GNAT superfamily N-acetyltransferase [Streptomyces sp. SPB4]
MQIEQATEQDVDVISVILGEIEAYYGGQPIPADGEQIRAALFGAQPAATVLLARAGDEVVGMASFSFLWPAAGADRSLYLKELYVREAARRQGVAGALIAAVRDAAAKAGCSRVEWTADTDNPAALSFYQALGAEPHRGKIFYRTQGL